ncbi:tetratricopeptide repeat protein [Nisaea sediminum]|uniref:tetratricopeptide repeat protein n=1 Tax=Nisaea sediminum TaxID=2775867 RepID=UPI001865BD52|nr:tetratricopeptide repeat protein [Nisaea sediminum]
MTSLAEKVLEGEPNAVRQAENFVRSAGHDVEANELRKALVQHYTRSQGARRDAGVGHLERDFEAALRHMRPLYEASPDHPGFAFRFASLLTETGRYDEGMPLLEKLREAGGTFDLTVNVEGAIARALYHRGEFDRAADLLRRILAKATEHFGAEPSDEQRRLVGSLLARLSRIHINKGDYGGAARIVEENPYEIDHPFMRRTLQRAKTLLSDGPPSRLSDARPVELDRLTVACVKHGTKYGPDYVNRLFSMVRRHLPGNWRFVCYTDDPRGLRPEVRVIDISGIQIRGWWTKLALFDPNLPVADPTIFYLDLDTVVVGDLGFLEGLKVGFHILEHPDSPCFNSSVMLFDRAFAAPVYQRIRKRDVERLVGDQDWIEECMPGLDTFPHGPIRLYRGLHPDLDPAGLAETGTRIVTFPTNPKPHMIEQGWVPEHWR